MPKITKIEEQKKAKNRVNIYVDDEFSFGMTTQLLVDYDIYKGKEVTSADIEKYKAGDNLSKCLLKAYRFLSYRPRTEKEMQDKLLEKFDPQVVAGAVEKLREYKYLNDQEFARLWVESRKAGRSARAISYELQKKGISKDVIEVAVAVVDRDSEFEAALELINNKSKYHNLSREEAYQKIGGFLSRRGYSYEIIKKVLDNVSYK